MADNSGLIVSALRQTDPELADSIDADNSWQASIKKQGARVKLYRQYERGDHRADLTDQMRDMLRLKKGDAEMNDFNDNYMKPVVDKMASRLEANLSIGEENKDWLVETLERNKFDASQTMWYRGAIRDGDSYVMVDPETLRWTSDSAYDGFSGITVLYDMKDTEPIWACKLWSEADVTNDNEEESESRVVIRIMVYQRDTLTEFVGVNGGKEAGKVPDGEKPWPIDKLPVIAFVNQMDSYTTYGESELRPAISLQDTLNRTMHSMVMASEFSAFSLLWSIGFEIDVSSIVPGSVINLVLKDKEGEIITGLSEEELKFLQGASVGQFEASDISQYTNQITQIVQEISHTTQTPMYGVTTSGQLSGEALKQLEIGLLGKIERFQNQNADSLKSLVLLTAEMQNEFDPNGNAPDIEAVSVIWKPAEILDVNARIETLVKLREKAPGLFPDEFYIKRIGSLVGMSADDILTTIEKAENAQSNFFNNLTGGAGNIPVV